MMKCITTASIAIFFALSSPVVQAQNANLQPGDLDGVGIEQKLDSQIPLDLQFKDADGQEVMLGDYFAEKPVILTLVYYECPMLCGMILNGLLQSLNTLEFDVGKEFDIVTVSFDPDEGPDLAFGKKTTYVNKYGRSGAANGWHFLTGSQGDVEKLASAVGFSYRYDEARDEYVHASAIMIATPEGRLSKYFYGVEYPARDIRFGLIEAASSRIGTAVDQVLLYCYHYDPTTGKYGVAIMAVIRILGTLTVIVLGAFMIFTLTRERRHKRHLATNHSNGVKLHE